MRGVGDGVIQAGLKVARLISLVEKEDRTGLSHF